MDKNTAKLVADLARLLCVELDLHYSDIQLAVHNSDGLDAIYRAFVALRKADVTTPDVLEHVILRATHGAQHLKTIACPGEPLEE
jgi:hypothetical protein